MWFPRENLAPQNRSTVVVDVSQISVALSLFLQPCGPSRVVHLKTLGVLRPWLLFHGSGNFLDRDHIYAVLRLLYSTIVSGRIRASCRVIRRWEHVPNHILGHLLGSFELASTVL